MKPSILSNLAIVVAVGIAAFTTNKNIERLPATAMYYQSTDFSQAAVQNKSNWSSTSTGASCNGSNKACRVVVDDAYVSGGAFISTITLDAENSATAAALLSVRDNGEVINTVIDNRP